MTPAQINAAIATWMGWTHLERSSMEGVPPGYPMLSADGGFNYHPIPNYHGDLNACAEFQSRLDEEQQYRFCEELVGISHIGMRFLFRLTNATAPQRCEALLRTLNLWKE